MAEAGLTTGAVAAGRAVFLEGLRNQVEIAAEAAGGFIEQDFRIAGRVLRLRVAGPALVDPLGASFEHARIEAVDVPDLIVDAWDTRSTGVGPPARPWAEDDYREQGVVRGWFDDDLQVLLRQGANSITVLQPHEARAFYWTSAAQDMPFNEQASPLRPMLQCWYSAAGLQLTHAAALGGSEGCVLIAGRGGAGKSSITLACIDSEIGHLADDFCILGEDEQLVAHSLYSSVKAGPDTLDRMKVNPGWVVNPGFEPRDKAVIYLARHQRERMVERSPVKAIAVPVITGERDTRAVAAPPALALGALAPSTMFLLPAAGAATMAMLARAVRSTPCHRLEVGTDASQIPETLRAMGAQ